MTFYLILGIYLFLMLAVGLIGYRQEQHTPEDYFLASRGVGSLVLFFTFVATNFSAFFFLGFAGAGYRIGYSYYALMAFGTALAALPFYFVGFRSWKLGKLKGYITPAEMMQDLTGSKSIKFTYIAVWVVFTLPYLALQPKGAGIILNRVSEGLIPEFWGGTILTAFIVLYVFLGGMRSVALTDLIQGVLMFGLMLICVWVIARAFGGLTQANQQVYEAQPGLFSREGLDGSFTPKKWFSLMILWILCVPMFPQMFMRFFISKDVKAMKTSTVLYALSPLVLFICPIIIGVLGHLSFPGLTGKLTDNILPQMLLEHASPAIGGLIMVGALAAFMSTMDSQLLAISTLLTRDVIIPFLKQKTTFRQEIRLGKLFVVLLAVLGLLFTLMPQTIFDIVKMAFSGYAILFPATIAIFYVKKIKPPFILAAIGLGETLLFADFFDWLPTGWAMGFSALVPALVLSVLILVFGYLFSLFRQ
jgi:SSS family solute:Na+ symporter